MYPAYAVRLAAKRWTNETRDRCIERIDAWMEAEFPGGARPGNVQVRERSDDNVLRIVVEERHHDVPIDRQTIVTLLPHEGTLTFEVRVVLQLRTRAMLPSVPRPTPTGALLDLIADMTTALEVYDAGLRVANTPHVVAGFVGGQGIGALHEAPARTLPIVVETIAGKPAAGILTTTLARELAGVAHIVHLADVDALAGLNDYAAQPIGADGAIVVLWPKPAPTTARPARPEALEAIRTAIYESAARQPFVALPPVERVARQRAETTTAATPTGDSELARLRERVGTQQEHIHLLDEELAQADEHLEQLREQRDELIDELDSNEQALDERERTISGLREENRQLREQRDEAIKVIVGGEEVVAPPAATRVRTVGDAVREAERLCPNLVFLPSAHETAQRLQGPEPRRLLKDLRKLNQVVAAWRDDKFAEAGLQSYCRDVAGLDFVPNIGEDTAHKHAAWYTAEWKGQPVLLAAHLRRGRGQYTIRVYMHLDHRERTIVVGKIDKHGPDGTSG